MKKIKRNAKKNNLLEINEQELWFWAKLVSYCFKEKNKYRPRSIGSMMIDLYVVKASTAHEAFRKATKIGKSLESSYKTSSLTLHGEPAQQIFLGVKNIGFCHFGINDGVEICSMLDRTTISSAKRYVVNRKTLVENLQEEISPRLKRLKK